MTGTMFKTTPALTAEQEAFLSTVPDDTEEAPWMVMSDAQFWPATDFANSLRAYAERQGLPWYVAGMLPILYPRPGRRRKGQVAPDVLVAFVPARERDSYNLVAEGVFPAFVLEIVSPSSVKHDVEVKRRTYEALGAEEYALFDPRPTGGRPALQGYRRAPAGQFVAWQPDARGRLWSEVLELFVVAEGRVLRAVLPDGTRLLTYRESEQARVESEAARAEEEAARRRAEAEAARLRAEIERLRGDG
jgi:Uma2 family endonuclease